MIEFSFHDALRYTEIMLGVAFILQSIEHLRKSDDPDIFLCRIGLSITLILGPWAHISCLGLSVIAIINLHRYNGPYNGGSDRMGLLILFCVTTIEWMPSPIWKVYIFGYLALQLVLSYFISGWVKIVNPDWRSGRALTDVFMFSTYPVSEHIRNFHKEPTLMLMMSWCVIGFELLFPLTIFDQKLLFFGLLITATFHFVNACIFGLNRFFWVWIAAYPSIIWLQAFLFQI